MGIRRTRCDGRHQQTYFQNNVSYCTNDQVAASSSATVVHIYYHSWYLKRNGIPGFAKGGSEKRSVLVVGAVPPAASALVQSDRTFGN